MNKLKDILVSKVSKIKELENIIKDQKEEIYILNSKNIINEVIF